ncbi:MAG: hypothetical protein IT380_15720 [Myxococcales bacterium]|nr:hypothetical protein [Myxococcales bacterium]
MNARVRFLSLAVAAAAVMSGSGCVCVSGVRGDVSFLWTFNGKTCAQSPEVASVTLRIPGQTLMNDGVYSCTNGGADGIKLLNFRPGAYSYEIEGRSNQGAVLYATSGTFTVDGDVLVNAALRSSGGDVTFFWTFNGQSCAMVPSVTQVTIQIPGQTLPSSGTFPCLNGGVNGIVLVGIRDGAYTYAIQGRNSAGAILYQLTGNLTVNGNVTVNADLAVAPGAPGDAQFTWRFPATATVAMPTCAQAEGPIVKVLIRIDGDAVGQEFDCSAGDVRASPTATGVIFPGLTAGNHTIDLAARDANNFYYYRKLSNFTVVAGSTTANEYTFDWGVGALPIKWTFNNGTTQVDCAQAGISTVTVQLRDSQDQDLYPGSGVQVPCLSSAVQGTRFPFLYPDTYKIYLQATGTAGVLYTTNFTTPPTGMVAAGQFPLLDSTAPTFVLIP